MCITHRKILNNYKCLKKRFAKNIERLICACIRQDTRLFKIVHIICILFLGPSTWKSNERIKTLSPSTEYWHGNCYNFVCHVSYLRVHVFSGWNQRQHHSESSSRCVVGRYELLSPGLRILHIQICQYLMIKVNSWICSVNMYFFTDFFTCIV